MSKLRIKEVFRTARPYSSKLEKVDGYRNHFNVTDFAGNNLVLLESGINKIAEIHPKDGKRRPAILIRSSPHKIGSEQTPWQDVFDVDNGHIRYYGDNKTPGKDPMTAPGNKILLEAFESYNIIDKRPWAPP